MLELRQRTLADVVDLCMVVVCTRTHQDDPVDRGDVENDFVTAGERSGMRARLFWVEPERVLERNGRFFERPRGDRGGAGSRFYAFIERQHRDGMRAAVETVTNDPMTTCLQSDLDEIPTPEAVLLAARMLETRPLWIAFAQRFHSTGLDLLHPQQPWFGSCGSRLADMEPQKIRDARTTIGTRDQEMVVIDNAGIHASWLGTDVEREKKLHSFSHFEVVGKWDPAEGRRTRRHANGEVLTPVSLSASYQMWWPKPLIDGTFEMPTSWISEEDAWSEPPPVVD